MKTWSKKKKDCYHDFLEQMIKDGYVEENPKRWARPKYAEVENYFCARLGVIGIGGSNAAHNERETRAKTMAKEFFDYWEDLDWMRKKTRMKCFKRSANTWIANSSKFNKEGMPRDLKKLEEWAKKQEGGRGPRPGESEYEYREFCKTLNDD